MKTNVKIDEALLSEAKALSQAKTKKQVVEQALQYYIKSRYREQMLELRGKVEWEGDLDQMRTEAKAEHERQVNAHYHQSLYARERRAKNA